MQPAPEEKKKGTSKLSLHHQEDPLALEPGKEKDPTTDKDDQKWLFARLNTILAIFASFFFPLHSHQTNESFSFRSV